MSARALRRLSLARPASIAVAAAWAIALVFTLAIVRHGLDASCFFSDELDAFLLFDERPVTRVLLAELGWQIVPLHRLLMLVVSSIAPMSWGAAVLVVALFHALGIIYLYRTLELLQPTALNSVIVVLVATNVLAGAYFMWFSSGVMRAPYIALSLIAIYHYLHFCRTERRLDLVVVGCAYVLALGFYSKAILIPLYCAAIDLAWRGTGAFRGAARPPREWWLLIALFCTVPLYVLAVRSAVLPAGRALNLEPVFLARAVGIAIVFLAHSLVAIVPSYEHYAPNAWILAGWALFIAYTVIRRPKNLSIWMLCILLVALNAALIAASHRGAVFGEFVLLEPRYYFELCFIVAIFIALVLHPLLETAPELRWITTRWRATALVALMPLVLLLNAITSFRAFRELAPSLGDPRTCVYLSRIQKGLAALNSPSTAPPSFQDGFAPKYVGFMVRAWRHSELFRALHVRATFNTSGDWRVAADGRIVPAVQAAPAAPPAK